MSPKVQVFQSGPPQIVQPLNTAKNKSGSLTHLVSHSVSHSVTRSPIELFWTAKNVFAAKWVRIHLWDDFAFAFSAQSKIPLAFDVWINCRQEK